MLNSEVNVLSNAGVRIILGVHALKVLHNTCVGLNAPQQTKNNQTE